MTFFAVDCSTHGPARCTRQGECVLCGEKAPVGLVAPTDGVWLDEHGRLHIEGESTSTTYLVGQRSIYVVGQYPRDVA